MKIFSKLDTQVYCYWQFAEISTYCRGIPEAQWHSAKFCSGRATV